MENPFAAWIREVGLTKHAVALSMGVQDPAIWKLTRAGYRPNRRNLMRIWRFTGGAVTPDAMLLNGEHLPKNSAEHKSALRAIRIAEREKERANAQRKKGGKSRAAAGYQRFERRAEG